jgi:hypothetical protein
VLYSAHMSTEDVPDWWPYAVELPRWQVWRGVNGLVYAQLADSSPPLVVRGEDIPDLRDAIRRKELREP